MGIDACIYVRTRDGLEPDLRDSLPGGATIMTPRGWAPAGATHEVHSLWRYYGPGYERGPWPKIAAALLVLFASPNVETVWYQGDTDSGDHRPFTPERLHEFNAHFMQEGYRLAHR